MPSPARTRPSGQEAGTPAPSAAAAKSAPARALDKLGLSRDIDLALHLPLRYEDETRLTPLAEVLEGDTVQVEGVVADCRVELRSRRQLVVRLVAAEGGPGELVLRFLHFYPSHQKTLARGARVRVRGEVRGGFFGREMVHPQFKAVVAGAPLAAALTPVYPATAQLPQAYLRKAIAGALTRAPLEEVLPPGVVPPGLPTLRQALQTLHHPSAAEPQFALQERTHPAWQRLKFEELLAQQLSQLTAQRERTRLHAPALRAATGGLPERLLAALPFALTGAQNRVVQEIAADLARAQPMHRLLQGDVGSGKTVVAALAAAVAMDAGWQCALMAPTEILAEQHFSKLVQWLQPLGVQVAWLSGSRKGKLRAAQLQAIATGQAGLVVGTHAVIQEDVHFARLGLALIDEQHRFGVAQRLALRHKLGEKAGATGVRGAGCPPTAGPSQGGRTPSGGATGVPGAGGPPTAGPSQGGHAPSGGATGVPGAGGPLEPHLLMMTATPIPRTLAMTYFADLEVSTIDELPPGRTPVLTKVFAEHRRAEVVHRIEDELAQGRQAYWVCPLIEESDLADGHDAGAAGRPALDLANAKATHAELSAALPGRRVGLVHGRLPAAEKSAVMAAFKAGDIDLLVATTVIEVGVDVPNASLMVIEHAERFGLSQLHQLRGRVGRGAAASVCVLLYAGPLSPTGRDRLRAMAETQDGFEIARRDLEIRGPGEFMGARQSGDALLRFADLADDAPLLEQARRQAPRLLNAHPEAARAHVARWLGSRMDYLKA